VNNVVQEPGSGKAYTASGTTLTLSAALTNGTDEMYCVFLGKAVGTVNAPAGSVNTSQLAGDAVTEAKIADGAVESEHLNNNVISGQTELASEPADTDEFLVSDAGTIKRIDYSLIKGGGKVLQVVFGSTSTETRNNTNTLADTGLSASITPSATSSKVLIIVMQNGCDKTAANAGNQMILKLLRGSTQISTLTNNGGYSNYAQPLSFGTVGGCLLDEPSSTSALTYKTQFSCGNNTAGVGVQGTGGENSHITLIEIGA
jgi:hypothetical protein